MDDSSGVWAFVIGNLVIAFFLWLLVFGVLGAIAALVAPRRRRLTFFLLTFLLLGPIGIVAASIANTREPKLPPGSRELFCRRCAARNVVDNAADAYVCWRCSRDHGVLPKA